MRSLFLVLPAVLLASCAPPAAGPAPAPAARWTASLEARPAFEAVSAGVTAIRTVGATTVQIELTGAEAGTTFPWHVHRGSCASGGPIVGEAERYPPLRVGTDGRGLGTAVLEVELEVGQAYHVNVHQSPQNLAAIVACGDLQEAGANPTG